MTPEETKTAVLEWLDSCHEGQWSSIRFQGEGHVFYGIDDLEYITVIEAVGGNEGEGSHTHLVLKVLTKDRNLYYFKKEGSYDSWDGSDWDDTELYQVEPRQKVINVYEPVVSAATT
jgi:hypothetical protein